MHTIYHRQARWRGSALAAVVMAASFPPAPRRRRRRKGRGRKICGSADDLGGTNQRSQARCRERRSSFSRATNRTTSRISMASTCKQAAKKLGWKLTVIDGKGSPTSWLAGMNQAIALKPDGIAMFADAASLQGPDQGRRRAGHKVRRPACRGPARARSPTSGCSSTYRRIRAKSARPRPTGRSPTPTARRGRRADPQRICDRQGQIDRDQGRDRKMRRTARCSIMSTRPPPRRRNGSRSSQPAGFSGSACRSTRPRSATTIWTSPSRCCARAASTPTGQADRRGRQPVGL